MHVGKTIIKLKKGQSLQEDLVSRNNESITYATLIKSGLVYGVEAWRITENNRRKLEAVEINMFRRSLRISIEDRIRNEELNCNLGQKNRYQQKFGENDEYDKDTVGECRIQD